MERLLLVAVLAVVVLAFEKEEFMKNCDKFLSQSECCKDNRVKITPELDGQLKECSKLPGLPACDQDICMATKRGYGTPDGKIDQAKAEKDVEALFSDLPTKLAAIKSHCFNGAYENKSPADICQILKFNTCVELHEQLACTEWSDDSNCKDVKQEMEKCSKFLS